MGVLKTSSKIVYPNNYFEKNRGGEKQLKVEH
jgi:hypothetical protein